MCLGAIVPILLNLYILSLPLQKWTRVFKCFASVHQFQVSEYSFISLSSKDIKYRVYTRIIPNSLLFLAQARLLGKLQKQSLFVHTVITYYSY